MDRQRRISVTTSRRGGFTLVEMLVVIVIMLTLATLALALMPRFGQTQKVASGADLLQGWLAVARQRALRDQTPTGIRLLPDANNYVREMQYIQQPDDFNPTGSTISVSGTTATAGGSPTPDYTGGQSSSALQPVQAGDYLEVKGGGLVHRITNVSSSSLTLQSSPTNTIAATSDYRIIRAPRLLTGEPSLQMPADVAIDLSTNATFGNPLPTDSSTGNTEVLFAPSGAVIGRGTGNDKIILWVRDVSLDSISDGQSALITVYIRTGLIAAHPVDTSNSFADPYSLTRDGRSSGM